VLKVSNLIEQGGLFIYPLIIVSVIIFTVILERFFVFLFIKKSVSDLFMQKLKNYILLNQAENAYQMLNKIKGPIGLTLKQAINHIEKDPEIIKEYMASAEIDSFPQLEKRLGLLNFLGKISPTLGLLGTVAGMIKIFHVLSLNGEPTQLAGGISEALLTTAAGLIISIPALAAYYFFISRLDNIATHLEKRKIELLNFLKESSEVNNYEI